VVSAAADRTLAFVRVSCEGCGEFPWWAGVLLGVFGVAMVFVILYGLYRLTMRFVPAAQPQEGADPPDDASAP
jgi:hypothetical protein